MDLPAINVFFYGSFINVDILAKGGLVVDDVTVAKLWGFDIRISTLATLVRSDHGCVYGIVTKATHADLDRLYAQAWLGHAYRPEPVIVERQDAQLAPALCYIAHTAPPARPANEYLDWILIAARRLGFPGWYIERLQAAGR
jgi:hypothetical protein